MPSRLKQYFRKEDAEGCLKVLAEWVLGTLEPGDLETANLARAAPLAESRLRDVLGVRALERNIVGTRIATWLGKVAAGARKMQRETPLSDDDIAFIQDASSDSLERAGMLIDRKQPRWLMGWRRNARSTDERTWVVDVLPLCGVGDSIFMNSPECGKRIRTSHSRMCRFTCRGLHFSSESRWDKSELLLHRAIPHVIAPNHIRDRKDLAFITPRVLELTYTSHSMRPWAEDLGHTGAPFAFDSDRRAQLRAELDAFFARKYGLSRDELRYILDPADTHGESYPSETFRGLKRNETERYGEYRTQRLVLTAFDRLTGG